MKRSEKAKKINLILDKLYPSTPIPLDHYSAYTLLVAVMLSAQTTDKKVNQVTPELFKQANTPEKMSKLSTRTIQNLIREIGLAPTKAKNIKKMANQIIEAGGLRPDWDYLESLAGVGHKTASVVMSQWYGFPAFPVDTHIHRLAARWGLSKGRMLKGLNLILKGYGLNRNGISCTCKLYFLDGSTVQPEIITLTNASSAHGQLAKNVLNLNQKIEPNLLLLL